MAIRLDSWPVTVRAPKAAPKRKKGAQPRTPSSVKSTANDREERACAYEPCSRVTKMTEKQRYRSHACANRSRRGEKHKEKVGYSGLHQRLHRERGKADRCIIFQCDTGNTQFEWANISGEYKDTGDFMPMCRAHHRRYDKPEKIEVA